MELPRTAQSPDPPLIVPRACLNCARAKAKCVNGQEFEGKCQRCHRLKKQCEPSPARARPQPRKRSHAETTSRVAKNRVSKLEEKLEDLVTLLKSSHENGSAMPGPISVSRSVSTKQPSVENSPQTMEISAADPPDPRIQGVSQAERWDNRLLRGGPPETRFGVSEAFTKEWKKLPFPLLNPTIYKLDELDLGAEDPDELLTIFRKEMQPGFPFITISDFTLASDLREDRPSLFTAIMAVVSRNSARQRAIGKVFMKQVADRVVVGGERNMDILLGILTYSAWCYYHFFNIPQLTLLLTTATTLISDLCLMRNAVVEQPGPWDTGIRESCGYQTALRSPRTLEERRAALGHYLILSTLANFFHRLEAPRWTSYLDECCQILIASDDQPNDKTAVSLVKIQVLADKIGQSPWHGRVEALHVNTPPPVLYLGSLREQLKELKRQLSLDQTSHVAVLLSFANVQVILYKFGLSKNPLITAFSAHDFNRLEYLYTCLQGVQSFFDIIFAIPRTQYRCFSTTIFTQITWNLGILQLLSTFEHPDWNLTWVKETISFTGVLGQIGELFSQAKHGLGLDPHTSEQEDIFSMTGNKMAWMKAYFEGKYRSAESVVPMGTNEDGLNDMPYGEDFIDFLENDPWMRDILGPYDYSSMV